MTKKEQVQLEERLAKAKELRIRIDRLAETVGDIESNSRERCCQVRIDTEAQPDPMKPREPRLALAFVNVPHGGEATERLKTVCSMDEDLPAALIAVVVSVLKCRHDELVTALEKL